MQSNSKDMLMAWYAFEGISVEMFKICRIVLIKILITGEQLCKQNLYVDRWFCASTVCPERLHAAESGRLKLAALFCCFPND